MIIRALKNLVKPFTGIPAPDYLEDDEWFGPATLSERQLSLKEARKKAEEDNQILPEENVPKEVANIHEVMYNIATGNGNTTTQLDPMPELGGGSEQIQSSPGGWLSGTGMRQFH
jgi:hypothetical protein